MDRAFLSLLKGILYLPLSGDNEPELERSSLENKPRWQSEEAKKWISA